MITASIWPDDPTFGEVLVSAGLNRSPFVALPETLSAVDVATPEALMEGLVRMLHVDAGVASMGVVFVWTLDRPYPHPSGNGEPSTVSYIEQTKRTIKRRWPRSELRNFTTDDGCSPNVAHPGDNIAALADGDFNWSFMSQVIPAYGPMRVWWATIEDLNLNASADTARQRPKEWEGAILAAYRERYGRLPLRNRRG